MKIQDLKTNDLVLMEWDYKGRHEEFLVIATRVEPDKTYFRDVYIIKGAEPYDKEWYIDHKAQSQEKSTIKRVLCNNPPADIIGYIIKEHPEVLL